MHAVRYLLFLLIVLPAGAAAQVPHAWVAADGRWWQIDTLGNRSEAVYPPAEVLSRSPERDTVLSGGIYLVRRSGWQGTAYRFYTAAWRLLRDTAFDYAEPFEHGYALVMTGSCMNAIDSAGHFLLQVAVPGMHPGNTVQSMREDRILVIVKEKDKICNCDLDGPHFGFRKKDGSWAIAPTFRTAGLFSHGRAVASDDGVSFGYLDTAGTWAIPPVYESARPFATD